MNIAALTIDEIREGLSQKTFSAVEVAEEQLRFASQENAKTNALLRLTPERAIAAAKRVDEQFARSGSLGRLANRLPSKMSCHERRGDYVRLQAAGALCSSLRCDSGDSIEEAGGLIIGKANCDEFAMGSSNENSAFGPVRNPVDLNRVPGGSSGGSAACVAQGTAVVSLGSDTGGSVRQPASFCGIVGVTPTYGRISRYGLVAFASSLDHIGPFARNVRDAATLTGVMAGRDENDATSAAAPVPDYTAALNGDVRGMKIGLPAEYFKGLATDTGDRIAHGVETLKKLGCEVRDVTLPSTDYAIATYYIICTAEASSNLARYDGVRYTERSKNSDTLSSMYRNTRGEGFGAECKRRIMLGTYVLSAGYYDAYYLKAQKVRALIARDFARAFEQVDAIVTPVSPFPAFKLGEKLADPLEMYLSDIYTITGSLAGIPCMSVPCGKTDAGLPVGMQILTKHFAETEMFRLAYALEQATR
ncbi:MAG: Asp-tRNA(Asn)/Glu-tRNA(Gln) amidotransferase subunit GatA [Bryobacteraceae bacterium]